MDTISSLIEKYRAQDRLFPQDSAEQKDFQEANCCDCECCEKIGDGFDGCMDCLFCDCECCENIKEFCDGCMSCYCPLCDKCYDFDCCECKEKCDEWTYCWICERGNCDESFCYQCCTLNCIFKDCACKN